MEWVNRLLSWADNDQKSLPLHDQPDRTDWGRVWPFVLMHVFCFAALWVGYSAVAIAVAIALYLVRMFAITAFFHRYFAHKSFSTSRPVQFIFAIIGTAATQRGPLWWAGHHRQHHTASDTPADPHSPLHGFWHSHCGWFLGTRHFRTPTQRIKDFTQYRELVWLDRFDVLVPILLCIILWCVGEALANYLPQLHTSGLQLVIWGYFISTVVLLHSTLAVNSLAHRIGSQRYQTTDDSRNNWWLALITLGEGWHNNHHHYAGSARQGFFWWEIDISYYLLRVMEKLGLVWDLRAVPHHKKWAHKPDRLATLTVKASSR